MKKPKNPISFSLSDSETALVEKPKRSRESQSLKKSEFSISNQNSFFEKNLNSKLMMKVLSCEDFRKLNNTFDLDKTMKNRKKNVLISKKNILN